MHKNRTVHIITIIGVALFVMLGLASGTTGPATNTEDSGGEGTAKGRNTGQAAGPYFTGDGGKNMRLGILVPESQGLSTDQAYIPAMVQGVLVSNISRYSGISVLDRVSLDKVIAETLDAAYEDNLDIVRLGHVAQVGYMMTGKVIRTSSGYTLQINVTDTTPDAKTIASYSGVCTVAQLDDQTAIQKASQDLLTQMGVKLSSRAITELGAMNSRQSINAQTALARGVTAQKQGTEVEALSYYYHAAALDSSLLEAASRVSVLSANISSGNIGADTRNDIQWRKDWVARLTECEEFIGRMISTADPPYSLFYCTEIKKGDINYQTETISLSFETNLHGIGTWFSSVRKTVQAVYDGLNATKRKSDWGLANWPQQSLSRTNPFSSQYAISAVFELVNDQNRVIGSQTLSRRPAFRFLGNENRITTDYTGNEYIAITFNAVKADDISDVMTIRVASVNGAVPENTPFQITALPPSKWQEYRNPILHLNISNGVLIGFNPSLTEKRKAQYLDGRLFPDELWGEQPWDLGITSIAARAFTRLTSDGKDYISPESPLTSVTIPYGVTSIGAGAFASNKLTSITIPDSVTFIGVDAFCNNFQLASLTIGGSDVTIEKRAFLWNKLTRVTIGANAKTVMDQYYGPFYTSNFEGYYNKNGKKAGTYTFRKGKTSKEDTWIYSP